MSNTKVTKKRTTQRKPSQGLGDTIEKVTRATGIKKAVEWALGEDCGCEERKEKLNKLFSYSKTPKCMTELEFYWWGNFKSIQTEYLSKDQSDQIAIIWNRIFGKRSFYRPCNCNPREWKKMIDEIDIVYKEYAKG
jgi:predicted Zn-ribbon and HTH transcriptional regulator